MTSLSELIGLNKDLQAPSLSTRADPDSYASLAPAAHALGKDIRVAYHDALFEQERSDHQLDLQFIENANTYVSLSNQISTSLSLLSSLSQFLSSFQTDLSSVSEHISSLQSRSTTLESRLESRRRVEGKLRPLVDGLILTPDLVDKVWETDPSSTTWVETISELDGRLSNIRGGPRIISRKSLDEAAEAVRLKASTKSILHLQSLIKPFTLSLHPFTLLHSQLSPDKPLHSFLRQHSARQAHSLQKGYTNTARWWYETAFRRYVRALEKVRARSVRIPDLIGKVEGGGLALLSGKRKVERGAEALRDARDSAGFEGSPPIDVARTSDATLKPPPEALFRSLMLILYSSLQEEYAFLSHFFTTTAATAPPTPSTPFPPSSPSPRYNPSESGQSTTTTHHPRDRTEDNELKFVERLMGEIFEPAIEYTRDFIFALLPSCSPVSLLGMLALLNSLEDHGGESIKTQLQTMRMVLQPSLGKSMDSQSESVRNLAKSGAKDSVVRTVLERYSALYIAFVVLSPPNTSRATMGVRETVFEEADEEKTPTIASNATFPSSHHHQIMTGGLPPNLIRLRKEVETLVMTQASKAAQGEPRKQYVKVCVEEVLGGLANGGAELGEKGRELGEVLLEEERTYWRVMRNRVA